MKTLMILLLLTTPVAAQSVLVDCNSCRGSGCIVDTDGCGTYWVLTAAHVVNDQNSVSIVLEDGTRIKTKVLRTIIRCGVGNDKAVLRFRSSLDLPITPLSRIRAFVGQKVKTIGFPGRVNHENPVTQTGVITSLDGSLQTDFTARAGQSGSPLFNADGVIGVIGHAGRGSYATKVSALKNQLVQAEELSENLRALDQGIQDSRELERIHEATLFDRLRNRRPGDGCGPEDDCDDTDAVEPPVIPGVARTIVDINSGVNDISDGVSILIEAERARAVEPDAAINYKILALIVLAAGGLGVAYRYANIDPA